MELSSPKIKKFQMELFELDKQKKKEPKRITKNHRTEKKPL